MVALRTPAVAPAMPQACADAAKRAFSSAAASAPRIKGEPPLSWETSTSSHNPIHMSPQSRPAGPAGRPR